MSYFVAKAVESEGLWYVVYTLIDPAGSGQALLSQRTPPALSLTDAIERFATELKALRWKLAEWDGSLPARGIAR